MATSRSALDYLRRIGLAPGEHLRPRPRLNISELLIHTVPLTSPPLPATGTLRSLEGDPPPDRGAARPWPGQ